MSPGRVRSEVLSGRSGRSSHLENPINIGRVLMILVTRHILYGRMWYHAVVEEGAEQQEESADEEGGLAGECQGTTPHFPHSSGDPRAPVLVSSCLYSRYLHSLD